MAKKQITIDPAHNPPKVKGARKKVESLTKALFKRQSAIAVKLAKEHFKATKADKPKVNRYIVDLMKEFKDDYEQYVEDVAAGLEDAALAGTEKGILDLDISDVDMINACNAQARDYAFDRGAEMVGMKYDEDDILIENPDAEWAISDVTRENLRDIIAEAFDKETPMDDLIADIKDAGAFSDYRAEMIARTEVSMAQSNSNYDVWVRSGIVKSTQWLLSADHPEDEECECTENEEEIVEIGDVYPSGDSCPPAHQNCECILVAVDLGSGEDVGEETDIEEE